MPSSLPFESRYALYFVPAKDSELYHFGRAILGYDSYTGQDFPFAEAVDGDTWMATVAEPRRYGFHATLKAPFYLAEGRDEAHLIEALASFARQQASIDLENPSIQIINAFAAIILPNGNSALHQLADACVRKFDHFRRHMTDQERARRMASGLTKQQIAMLDRWGYPYVGSAFRFHMTLTGSLSPDQQPTVLNLLNNLYQRAGISTPIQLDRIALLKQHNSVSPFRIVTSFSLQR